LSTNLSPPNFLAPQLPSPLSVRQSANLAARTRRQETGRRRRRDGTTKRTTLCVFPSRRRRSGHRRGREERLGLVERIWEALLAIWIGLAKASREEIREVH